MFCKQCGAKLDDAARFCESCGAQVRSAQTGGGRRPAAAQEPMTHCGRCKRQVPLYGDEKCPYCGAVVHEPTGPVCPRCGTRMQDAARTCVVCGADIPGRYETKPAKRTLSWMVYRKSDGLYGVSMVGWIVLTLLAVAVLGVVYVIALLAA